VGDTPFGNTGAMGRQSLMALFFLVSVHGFKGLPAFGVVQGFISAPGFRVGGGLFYDNPVLCVAPWKPGVFGNLF